MLNIWLIQFVFSSIATTPFFHSYITYIEHFFTSTFFPSSITRALFFYADNLLSTFLSLRDKDKELTQAEKAFEKSKFLLLNKNPALQKILKKASTRDMSDKKVRQMSFVWYLKEYTLLYFSWVWSSIIQSSISWKLTITISTISQYC